MWGSDIPRVALLVETARGYGRDLLRGVVSYARLHGPWSFYVTPGDFEQMLPRMQRWKGTGIIARIETSRVANAIVATGLPTIALDLSDAQRRVGCPLSRMSEVASDSHAAARMAAEHLLDLGLQHFGFVGIANRVWSDRRREAFISRIHEAGFEAHVYHPGCEHDRLAWDRDQPLLRRWLRGLPKPIGILACNDDRGREVLVACRDEGLHVPEQAAVVGIDNDELLCELADPPLSSVALNAQAGGYRVAGLLDDMMRGGVREPRRLLIEPLHVVTRRSTAIDAHQDQDVAAALRFIQEQAGRPIAVGDIVKGIAVSRRSLEIRFRKAVGRTLHEEIQRVRIERACRLLIETDRPIPQVAFSAGFASASYLTQVFRRVHGMTPTRYRRAARGQGAE